ncbi:MAG: CHAD domain-containing protein [Bauldia sp.]|nr:CHAD domain-containing protein [Bauldia sp.]
MAHCIGKDENVGKALWRLLSDDIDEARQMLSSSEETPDQRVHRARQRLKRARSTLGVLKPVIGHSARDLRRSIAAAARLLAVARDADVVAATARNLREMNTPEDDAGLDRVIVELDRRAKEAHRIDAPVEEVIARLSAVEVALEQLRRKIDGAALFDTALAVAYRNGREAMERARLSPSTPDLHGWRKDVKTLWHLICLGGKRVPKPIRGMADDLGRLGDLLGYDHDHAVLAERLALSPEANHSLMRQLSMIAAERHALESEAFAIGRKVYKRKPKAFARKARLD